MRYVNPKGEVEDPPKRSEGGEKESDRGSSDNDVIIGKRGFSKNKIGRGTLFYFCGSLFLFCRRWTINLGHRPGEEKKKNLNDFPVFRHSGSEGGKSEPLSRFFLPIPYPSADGGRGAEFRQDAERTVYVKLLTL